MNMNEQSVGTPLSKNWTQLAEPKEERTLFHLGQESLQREKKIKVGIEKYTVLISITCCSLLAKRF